MRSRFVRPDTRTLTISDGDTLIVKRRLNHGEQAAAFARMYMAGVNGSLRVNPLETGLAMITAYLLDWSLRDDDGKPVVIREQPIEAVTAALNALDPESFAEVNAAIAKHEEEMTAARAEEKKMNGGPPVVEAMSSSPSEVAGPSSGSVN